VISGNNNVSEIWRKSQHEANKNNLDGIAVAESAEDKAVREKEEADRKKAEDLQKRIDADVAVATNYVQNYAPSGLVIDGSFYGTTSDKIVAFIRNKYPNKPLTNEMITDAIRTLWNSLDFFDRSDSALQFRNMAKPERQLSKQARIDAGLELDTDPRNHSNDSKFNNPADQLRKIVKKIVGETDPDIIAADRISVTNRYSKIDHAFTAELKKIFAHNPDGSINGKETRRLRMAAADQYEKRRNRDGGQRG